MTFACFRMLSHAFWLHKIRFLLENKTESVLIEVSVAGVRL